MTEYFHIKKSVDLSKLPEIKGYDFEKGFDLDKFVKSLSQTGIQATNLGQAVSIVTAVIREKVPVFLSFTSNMVSSGVREAITYLVKHKMVSAIVTSSGGVEEDAIKARMPFRLGQFNAKGESLLDAGVSRIGNIYATDENYTYFDFFMTKIFKRLLNEDVITPSKICYEIGKQLEKEKEFEHESSYLYWAYKNNIPVYVPAMPDGTICDLAYYFKKKHPEFQIDVMADHLKIIDYTMNLEKSAAIILGGSSPKHYVLNANIFKDGLDYAIYITTATEHDASDSGGNQEEAVSWAKIKPNASRVKVVCDASIAFPLLVAATWGKH